MPGARQRNFRLGDRSELLVQHLLTGIAFTTPVPRQEDIGIDFVCSLISGNSQGNLLQAGTSFSVQAKSNLDPVVYAKAHEVEWISHQENPLLLCVADRQTGAMDVYSTWNLLCAVQMGWQGQKEATSIRLLPGKVGPTWPGIDYKADGSLDVYLGKPIVRIAHDQIFDDATITGIIQLIEEWVGMDRINIVNRHAGLNWVVGPVGYETGKPPGAQVVSFYWNSKNLAQCIINLGRSATAVWRILHDFGLLSGTAIPEDLRMCIPHLRQLLPLLSRMDTSLRDFLKDLQ